MTIATAPRANGFVLYKPPRHRSLPFLATKIKPCLTSAEFSVIPVTVTLNFPPMTVQGQSFKSSDKSSTTLPFPNILLKTNILRANILYRMKKMFRMSRRKLGA